MKFWSYINDIRFKNNSSLKNIYLSIQTKVVLRNDDNLINDKSAAYSR